MSNYVVENTISPSLPRHSSSEPGTLVPGVRLSGVRRESAVQLPGLTSGARVARRQRGFTLVELLVVVFILLLVSAVSIPIIAPALQGRHIREASRQVNSYFAVARDTALRNGRPVGVSIERFISRDADGNVVLDENGNAAGLSEMSVLLQQVEVPESYSGDVSSSMMTVEYTVFSGPEEPGPSPPGFTTLPTETIPLTLIRIVSMGSDVGWSDLIRVGDQIQLNNQKRLYEITWTSTNLNKSRGSYLVDPPPSPPAPPSTVPSDKPEIASPPSTSFWSLTPIEGVIIVPSNATEVPGGITAGTSVQGTNPPGSAVTLQNDAKVFRINVPYTITRQPAKTSIPPLQLTGTVVLDLNWSGFNDKYFVQRGVSSPHDKLTAVNAGESKALEDKSPVVVMFSPSGAVSRLYYSEIVDSKWNWGWVQPTSAIHLLLGQRDGVPAAADNSNWLNLENLWITIHPQTGLLTTAENSVVDTALQTAPFDGGVRAARYFASRAKTIGGR